MAVVSKNERMFGDTVLFAPQPIFTYATNSLLIGMAITHDSGLEELLQSPTLEKSLHKPSFVSRSVYIGFR